MIRLCRVIDKQIHIVDENYVQFGTWYDLFDTMLLVLLMWQLPHMLLVLLIWHIPDMLLVLLMWQLPHMLLVLVIWQLPHMLLVLLIWHIPDMLFRPFWHNACRSITPLGDYSKTEGAKGLHWLVGDINYAGPGPDRLYVITPDSMENKLRRTWIQSSVIIMHLSASKWDYERKFLYGRKTIFLNVFEPVSLHKTCNISPRANIFLIAS